MTPERWRHIERLDYDAPERDLESIGIKIG